MRPRRPPPSTQRFRLERHRTPWSHLPLVLSPFLIVVAVLVPALMLEPVIGTSAATTIISGAGIGFAAFVVALPLIWPRWRRRGRFELEIEGSVVRLRAAGRVLGTATATPAAVRPCNFEYAVYTRSGGGRFRAPALVVILEGVGDAAIGGIGTALGWRGTVPVITRPDYVLADGDWRRLVDALGLAGRTGAYAARC